MKIRALVVEDNEDIAERIVEILQSLGHEHVWAKSQEDARPSIAEGGFSYVLLDLSIPVQFGRGLDSIEYGRNLAKEISQSPAMAGVPIIVMTAYGKEGLEIAAPLCEHGVVEFINKPFPRTGRTLASVIQAALERTMRKAEGRSVARLKADRPFAGGELTFYPDRIELCGVTVVSSKSSQMWGILDQLTRRLDERRYKSFPGTALAADSGQNGVAGSIRDFRRHVTEALGRELGQKVEKEDVVETSKAGYRLHAQIAVKDLRGNRRLLAETANAVGEGADSSLSDRSVCRRSRIMSLVCAGERLRVPAIAERLGCSLSTAKREVEALKAEGQMEFVGAAKTGHYRATVVPRPPMNMQPRYT